MGSQLTEGFPLLVTTAAVVAADLLTVCNNSASHSKWISSHSKHLTD